MAIFTDAYHPELKGKVAVVTGGGRGIGRAISIALSSAGTCVSVMSRSEDQLTETVTAIIEQGGYAVAIPGDVTDQKDVERLVSETEKQLGPVDILVNNAGSAGAIGPIWEVSTEAWWKDVTVNLKGTFLCTHALLPGMISRSRGCIINVASRFGIRQQPGDKPLPFASGYSSGKAGVIIFTDLVASTVRELGINIFALGPGLVRTTMTQQLMQSPGGQKWIPQLKTLFDKGVDNPVEKIAKLAAFLASGKADELSGCLIGIEDDLETMLKKSEEIRQEGLHVLRYCE
jgi:NAD(P)-dependent dehydrogenase (short-subunit alcohol dehydrogenase family)